MIKPYFSSKQARQSCNNLRTFFCFCLGGVLKYIFAFPVFMSGRGNEHHFKYEWPFQGKHLQWHIPQLNGRLPNAYFTKTQHFWHISQSFCHTRLFKQNSRLLHLQWFKTLKNKNANFASNWKSLGFYLARKWPSGLRHCI